MSIPEVRRNPSHRSLIAKMCDAEVALQAELAVGRRLSSSAVKSYSEGSGW